MSIKVIDNRIRLVLLIYTGSRLNKCRYINVKSQKGLIFLMSETAFTNTNSGCDNGDKVILMPCAKLIDHSLRLNYFDEVYIHELSHSIARYGLFNSLLVRLLEDDHYQIISGHNRLRAVLKLRWLSCPVTVIDCDDIIAKAMLAVSNSFDRHFSAIEEGLIVRDLHEQDKLDLTAIGKLFKKSKSWASRRLSLVLNLDEGIREEVQKGLLKARTAQEIVSLPRGNQMVFADCVKEHNLSKDETSKLVQALKSTGFNDKVFDACIRNPKGYLQNILISKDKEKPEKVTQKEKSSLISMTNQVNFILQSLLVSMEEKSGDLSKEEMALLKKACSGLNFNIVRFSKLYEKIFLLS